LPHVTSASVYLTGTACSSCKRERRWRPGRARGGHHLLLQGAFDLMAEAEVRGGNVPRMNRFSHRSWYLMNSGAVQADLLLPSISLDFMHVRYALEDGFLNPFVHLIFILIEPITAKDVAVSKRWGCHSAHVFADGWIVPTLGVPPGSIQHIGGVVYPLRARLVMEVTQVFDRCRAKSSPG
jgi:hypothetical protein